MKKSALFPVLLLAGCGTSPFLSQVSPGYAPGGRDRISVHYLEHPDASISAIATDLLEQEMRDCPQIEVAPATRTDSLLQAKSIVLPRHLTREFIQSLHPVLGTKYFVIGGISGWWQPRLRVTAQMKAEVSASLTMYDLETGAIAWTITGALPGVAMSPADTSHWTARHLFGGMVERWNATCKDSIPPALKPLD